MAHSLANLHRARAPNRIDRRLEPTTQRDEPSTTRNVALAAMVGAIAGLALSPIPLLFDAAWLSWVLVPTFAASGAVAALVFPAAARPVRRPDRGLVVAVTPKLKVLVVGLFFALAALILIVG